MSGNSPVPKERISKTAGKTCPEKREFDYDPSNVKHITDANVETVHSAEPALDTEGYVLNLAQEFDNQATSPPPFQPPITFNILLVGETGSGKSTLINYLTNYFHNGSLSSPKVAIPTKFLAKTETFSTFTLKLAQTPDSETNVDDPSKIHTIACNEYMFQEGHRKYRFIDSPGFSDPEGKEKDDHSMTLILSAAEKFFQLAAIVVVINGTFARTTVNIKNTLNRIQGSIPSRLEPNILVVLTNCHYGSANFQLQSLKWKVPKENVFYMNNSAFTKSPEEYMADNRMMQMLQRDWETSMEEVGNLVKTITELSKVVSKILFQQRREQLDKIKAEANDAIVEIRKLRSVLDQLEVAKALDENLAADKSKYQKFINGEIVEVRELEESKTYNTICMKYPHEDKNIGPEQICHENCSSFLEKVVGFLTQTTAGRIVMEGDPEHTSCKCLKDGKCTVCKCGYQCHYRDKKVPKIKKRPIGDILKEEKALYEEWRTKTTNAEKQVSSLNNDLKSVRKALGKNVETMKKCCEEMKKICPHYNLIEELNVYVITLEIDATTLKSFQAREEAETTIKDFKTLVEELCKDV